MNACSVDCHDLEIPAARAEVVNHVGQHAYGVDIDRLRHRARTGTVVDDISGEIGQRAAIGILGWSGP